ncbi:3-phosphoshikimate 1-carboxyvinyltransferase [Arenibaculum sp.]|jgi:3-phosphoshikimate 1-carboxyvinyltransferase|uniref:3-phosphoshikimate 1-carboxyvinyltransferase n=1 Tax=Arenibaculum sp. TaxID=2865862 RepID=UPI002E12C0E2|nr:3-phosphoshikimate 1-carboxyvinyltransferase [Arenibaculum sp.]
MRSSFPPELEIHPTRELHGSITLPASKSSSTRAILAAALAEGRSYVVNLAPSNNVRALVDALRVLGATISGDHGTVIVDGIGRSKLQSGVTLNPGNSGIVLRLLLGITAVLDQVRFETSFTDSLGKRANIEMLHSLKKLGVTYEAHGDEGQLPILLNGGKIRGGETSISCRRSSQFLSGLLYLGGLLDQPLLIAVEDEIVAKSMVSTTVSVLKHAGIDVQVDRTWRRFYMPGQQRYSPTTHRVGSDPASTAALLAVASMVDSDVLLTGFSEEELGDGAVLNHLREIGVSIETLNESIRVRGGGTFRARDFDGSKAPDAVLALASLAAFADGTSRFYNIEHVRYKECDRISDFRSELMKAGIKTNETRDSLIIHGSPHGVPGGSSIDSHFDHGVIMAMSAIALSACLEMKIISFRL